MVARLIVIVALALSKGEQLLGLSTWGEPSLALGGGPSAAQVAILAAAVGVAADEALASRWGSVVSAWASAGSA